MAGFRALLIEDGGTVAALDDQARLDLLRELELLTRTVSSVGARVQVGFHASQVASQIEAGVAPSRAGRAVPDDLAHARMTSPYWGSRELTCAKALCAELPHTLAALTLGVITSHQARIVTEATTTLEPADRAEVDARLADRLPGTSSKEIGAAVRALVYEIDPAGFVERARKAAKDRGLSLRPCPDVMGLLSARLPAPQAIAVYQALRAAAEAKQAAGDPRTLNQLMVDELYERITGRTIVDGIDIQVGLVITDLALFEGASTAAELTGYGPVPAELARELLRPHGEGGGSEGDPREGGADEGDPSEGRADEGDPSEGRAEEGDPREDGADEDELGDGGEDEHDPSENSPDEAGARSPEGLDGADGPDGPTASTEQITARARADAAANANGFAGGHAPEGYCPDGGRCTDFSCSLVHGAPAPPDLSPPPSSSAGTATHGGARETAAEGTTGAADGGTDATDDTTDAADMAAKAAKVWLRRLFTDPVTGTLTGRDARPRLFTGGLRAFLVARDRTCRNSWCGAPIRHIDHITRYRDDGPTDETNGQGLCARCNLARERPRQHSPTPADYRGPPPLLDSAPRQPVMS